jgi:general transcription factor 3C polypeptide 5 (transcription factor C subunit 1)
MPDFVYSTTGSAFTNRFREQILSFDCKHYILR